MKRLHVLLLGGVMSAGLLLAGVVQARHDMPAFGPNAVPASSKSNVTKNKMTIDVMPGPSALCNDGVHLWVVGYDAPWVWVVEPQTMAVVKRLSIGANGYGCAYDGKKNVWVTNIGQDNIQIFDAKTLMPVATTTPGHNPTGMVFDGTSMWVANTGPDTLTKFNIDTFQAEATTTKSGLVNPQPLVFDGRYLWTASNSTGLINKIDPQTNQVIATTTASDDCMGLAVAGSYLYATSYLGHVNKINLQTAQVVATTTISGQLRGIAFDQNQTLLVAEYSSDRIWRLDAASMKVMGLPVFVGKAPNVILFDGKMMYASTYVSSTLSRIKP